jgi:hypothetical protein
MDEKKNLVYTKGITKGIIMGFNIGKSYGGMIFLLTE